MNRHARLIFASIMTLLLLLPAASGASASPTGYDIAPEFRDFYQSYGGVQTFGYAISPPIEEDGRLVQYTERQRLEHHPEHRGSEYEVLLGLLGREAASAEGRSFAPGGAIDGARFFEPTGQYLEPRFRSYWEQNGGIRIFGYPVTAPFWENGLLVQYTERARLEYHPDNGGSQYDVLLGRLGSDLLRYEAASPAAQVAETEQPAASEASPGSPAEALLETRLNQERAASGVPALSRVDRLNNVAAGRSQDMAERGYFSHTTPDGRTVFDIMRADGLNWSRAGETLHRNRAGAESIDEAVERAFNGFMNSSEHRRILMDERYQQFGIGHTYGPDGRHYFTVILMSP